MNHDPDDVQVDDEMRLVCTRCGTKLCDVERGDTFHSLAGVVADHEAGRYDGEKEAEQ